MEYRNIGASGLKVSTLGIGCNNFGGRLDLAQSKAVVHAALDHGVTHFDTADVYPMGSGGASEDCLGQGLGPRRVDVVVATKFGMKMDPEGRLQDGSRRYVIDAVEASLGRLGTDWIDLLYLHKPDPDTPIDETLRALDDLIRAGKVRYVASSNFEAWRSVEAHYIARVLGLNRFIATQEQYSLLSRDVEKEVIPVCEKYGLGLVPFFPLESGVLSGKYAVGKGAPAGTRLATSKPLADRFMTPQGLEAAARLTDVAKAGDKELIDLAFAWLLRAPVVPSVIAGASTPAQVARNAEAVACKLSAGEIDAVAAALD
jgi:aryl-alcohol dehydrogenase-like predicted oxidoreductase